MVPAFLWRKIIFSSCLENSIMLSPKGHLGENILVRKWTDSRILCLWEGALQFVRIIILVSKVFLSSSMYVFSI